MARTATTKPKEPKAPKAAKPAAKRKPAVRKTTTTTAHVKPAAKIKHDYIFAVGRRKEAVARVRWHKTGDGSITVNERPVANYLPTPELQQLVKAPLVLVHMEEGVTITAKVNGGGIQGQAEAIRLGIARALVIHDADLRLPLKRAGFLRRDPRVKERKKYGLKRARRAPQWQKR